MIETRKDSDLERLRSLLTQRRDLLAEMKVASNRSSIIQAEMSVLRSKAQELDYVIETELKELAKPFFPPAVQ